MIDYLVELLSFAIVLYVLYRYVWAGGLKLRRLMSARQDAIASEIEESAAARARLEQAESEYRQALDGARAESERIRKEAAAEGEQIVAELRARAEEEYHRMSVLNQARLAAERQSVVGGLRLEVGQLTLETAERLLREVLRDDARQRRMLDRLIADLDVRGQTPEPVAGTADPVGRVR